MPSVKHANGAKYALGIILNFVWMFILYRICIIVSESISSLLPYQICSAVYVAAATVLLVLYGMTISRYDNKDDGKTAAKPLLMWAFPIVVVLIIDVVDLIIVDYLIQLF